MVLYELNILLEQICTQQYFEFGRDDSKISDKTVICRQGDTIQRNLVYALGMKYFDFNVDDQLSLLL